MERLTQAELDAIRARAEKATEGPWHWTDNEWLYSDEADKIVGQAVESAGDIWFDLFDTDAEFIAHARQDVPKLLAEIESSKNLISQLMNVINHANELLDDAYDLLESDWFLSQHPTTEDIAVYLCVNSEEDDE